VLQKLILRQRREIGARVRGVREKKGLTQEQAAELTGIHAKHVGRIEAGSTNVTISTLIALAAAYEVRLAAFFEDDGRSKR
jgi:transcriptional regulator with XRE-family HTH domain